MLCFFVCVVFSPGLSRARSVLLHPALESLVKTKKTQKLNIDLLLWKQ